MRFGAFVPQGWRFDLVGIDPARQWDVMSGLASTIDADPNWESLWVYDHFHTTPQPSDQATHEAWTLMAAFAASTARVRLGQMCTCMSYREPTYLAKVAATVDLISGGRVEMGIGGGWYEHEWRAYGYGFPSAGERLGRLREGVEIFRQMWTTGSATLDGTYYQVDGALCHPQPVQTTSEANRIPMWIAGGGEKVTLKIAAQYADYTNFDGTPGKFEAKSAVLQQHCEDIGRDFAHITRSANYNVLIGSPTKIDATVRHLEERLAPYLGSVKAQEYAAGFREQPLVGQPEQIAETLNGLQASGMDYAICYFPDAAYDDTSLRRFSEEVIPAVS